VEAGGTGGISLALADLVVDDMKSSSSFDFVALGGRLLEDRREEERSSTIEEEEPSKDASDTVRRPPKLLVDGVLLLEVGGTCPRLDRNRSRALARLDPSSFVSSSSIPSSDPTLPDDRECTEEPPRRARSEDRLELRSELFVEEALSSVDDLPRCG
jgi:hypothetical protein